MAGRLLRSVASRLRRGGARSGPAGFLTPPATSCNEQRRGYGFVVGMAAGAALRSLATKLAGAPPAPTGLLPERALNNLVGSPKPFASRSSLSPLSKLDFSASLAKTRAGVAYAALFGSLVYMYGWVMPRLEKLDAKLKERNLNDDLTKTMEAVEHLLQDISARREQSSGLGKKPDDVAGNSMNAGKLESLEQPDGVTGNSTTVDKFKSVEMEGQGHSKDTEAPTDPHTKFMTNYNKLMADIAKLKLSLESS